MKAGVIRCQLTEDMCPGSTDAKVVRESGARSQRPVEIVGYLFNAIV